MVDENMDPTKPFDGVLDLDEPESEPTERYAAHLDDKAPPWHGEDQLFIAVDGHIHVRGGRFFHSRVVGRVRGEDGPAALGVLVDRFQELEDRFSALKREHGRSKNLVRNLKSLQSFLHWVEGAQAIGDFESLLERAHGAHDRLEAQIESSRATKLELVQRAEELADSTSWKATAEAMEDLMNEWKRAGSAGGAEDDALWHRFRTARSSFFDRRSENYAELRRTRGDSRKAKESLIERAGELAGSTDWQATFDVMQELMEEWKQAGATGRKQDEELWQRFRAAREPFFEARKAHFTAQRNRRPPQRHERGGPRGPRRDRAPVQSRGGGGGSRTRSSGTLHASLAEILGPLDGTFPDQKEKQGKATPKDGKKSTKG